MLFGIFKIVFYIFLFVAQPSFSMESRRSSKLDHLEDYCGEVVENYSENTTEINIEFLDKLRPISPWSKVLEGEGIVDLVPNEKIFVKDREIPLVVLPPEKTILIHSMSSKRLKKILVSSEERKNFFSSQNVVLSASLVRGDHKQIYASGESNDNLDIAIILRCNLGHFAAAFPEDAESPNIKNTGLSEEQKKEYLHYIRKISVLITYLIDVIGMDPLEIYAFNAIKPESRSCVRYFKSKINLDDHCNSEIAQAVGILEDLVDEVEKIKKDALPMAPFISIEELFKHQDRTNNTYNEVILGRADDMEIIGLYVSHPDSLKHPKFLKIYAAAKKLGLHIMTFTKL